MTLTRRHLIGGAAAVLAAAMPMKSRSFWHGSLRIFGLSISGAEYTPYAFPTSTDWTNLSSLNIKTVRLAIAWENIQPTLSSALDPTFLADLKSSIAAGWAAGIKTIVEIHNYAAKVASTNWGTGSPSYTQGGNGGSTGTGVNFLGDGTLTTAVFNDLWTRIATALVGTPGLAGYGLMNEPSSNMPIGTNLAPFPNAFGYGFPWHAYDGANPTLQAAGTNPLGANYGPAWEITSGTGYGQEYQAYTFAGSTAYTSSCYFKTLTGTEEVFLQTGNSSQANWGTFTATTAWQRFTHTYTPGAVSNYFGPGVYNAASGHNVLIANYQIEIGSSASAYAPNPYIPFAQGAIDSIRAVDAATPIYICGWLAGNAYYWQYASWDFFTLTGTNLIFEAHQYFDASNGGGGGSYSGTYDSYGVNTSSGVTFLTPFVSWLQTTGANGFIGEMNVPNDTTDNDPQWLVLQQNAFEYLRANSVPATLWFYNGADVGGNKLNVAPATTDPRVLQMLAT